MSILFAIPCLLASLLAPAATDPNETILIWADHAHIGNPVFVAFLNAGEWSVEHFPPSAPFDDNYSPCLAFGPDGTPCVAWAARRGTGTPTIYLSRRADGEWEPARRIGGGTGAWESMPSLAFDRRGNGWIAFSREAGSSTEIFCAPLVHGRAGEAEILSSPDVSPDVHTAIAVAPDGAPVVAWEGWKDGRARIFLSRRRNGRWTEEEIVGGGGAVDRVWPEVSCDAGGRAVVSWREGGRMVSSRERTGGSGWENGPETAADNPSFPLPDSFSSEGWLAGRGEDAPSSRRAFPLPRRRKREARAPRAGSGSFIYIGYGDSITYGHDYGSDSDGWYGSILAEIFSEDHPHTDYYPINDGYPQTTTYDLLYGGGDWDCPGIDSVLEDHEDAGMILVMGGTNDLAHIGNPSLTKSYLGEIVDRARDKGVEPVLATIIPRVDEYFYFADSRTLSLSYIAPLAEEKGCALADPFTEFMRYYSMPYFYNKLYGAGSDSWDGVHPAWWEGDYHIALAFYAPFAPPAPRPSIDYNGDGRPEIAVWQPATGRWAVLNVTRLYFGTTGDLPVPGDYNGDGTSEIAVFRDSPGLWRMNPASAVYFGVPGDCPVPADYDGDGTEEPAVFRDAAGLWAVRGVTRLVFGTGGDLPVGADFDLDGRAEFAVFRPSSGLWKIRGITSAFFGAEGDYPVPARYDRQGPIRIAIARTGVGLWAAREETRTWYGGGVFFPQAADWDGDGDSDPALFRSETSGAWALKPLGDVFFGAAGDLPVSSRIYGLGPAAKPVPPGLRSGGSSAP